MKVESVEETRSPQGKLRLRFDNGTSMLVFPAVITELCLYPGVEIPEAAMESLRDTCAEASARERAVRIISAAPVSRRELQSRLVRKGETEEHAQQAVQWLNELHLLDDAEVAAQIVRSGAAKGYGFGDVDIGALVEDRVGYNDVFLNERVVRHGFAHIVQCGGQGVVECLVVGGSIGVVECCLQLLLEGRVACKGTKVGCGVGLGIVDGYAADAGVAIFVLIFVIRVV